MNNTDHSTPTDFVTLCRDKAEYDELIDEADRQCALVLRCRHIGSGRGRFLRHCVSGLTAAETVKAAEWGREWSPAGWLAKRGPDV